MRSLVLIVSCAVVLVLLFRLMTSPIRRVWKLAVNLLCGSAALVIIELLGVLIGFKTGINIWNILLVTLLGLPGFGVILFLNLLL